MLAARLDSIGLFNIDDKVTAQYATPDQHLIIEITAIDQIDLNFLNNLSKADV